MNKKYVAALASGLALVPVVCGLLSAVNYVSLIQVVLASLFLMALPWTMLNKSKKWGAVCAIGWALAELGVVNVALNLVFGNLELALWYLQYNILSFTGLVTIAFAVLAVAALNVKVNHWVLYVPTVCYCVGYIWGGLTYGFTVISLVWTLAVNSVLALSAYLLEQEKPVATQGSRTFSLGADKTGFSYLDEYKKNMRK